MAPLFLFLFFSSSSSSSWLFSFSIFNSAFAFSFFRGYVQVRRKMNDMRGSLVIARVGSGIARLGETLGNT